MLSSPTGLSEKTFVLNGRFIKLGFSKYCRIPLLLCYSMFKQNWIKEVYPSMNWS